MGMKVADLVNVLRPDGKDSSTTSNTSTSGASYKRQSAVCHREL